MTTESDIQEENPDSPFDSGNESDHVSDEEVDDTVVVHEPKIEEKANQQSEEPSPAGLPPIPPRDEKSLSSFSFYDFS